MSLTLIVIVFVIVDMRMLLSQPLHRKATRSMVANHDGASNDTENEFGSAVEPTLLHPSCPLLHRPAADGELVGAMMKIL